jgi:TorA maturation chaperone TorD
MDCADTIVGYSKSGREVVRTTVEEPTFERPARHLNSILRSKSMQRIALYPTLDQAQAVARGHVYSFLAAALADPVREHSALALDPNLQVVAVAAAGLLASEAPESLELGPGELPPRELDLLAVVEEISKPREEIVRQHQEVFELLIGKSAPPYETEYCHSTLTFYRSQQLADAAGFYHAFALEQNRQTPERADHISVELEFMAHLIRKQLVAAGEPELHQKAPICQEAQAKFFEAHLAWWVPAFARLLERAAPSGVYQAIARALACFIPCERDVLGVQPARDLSEPGTDLDPECEEQCGGAMPCGFRASHQCESIHDEPTPVR